ncbi:hypothetical protein, partial [Burkholderia ubonensis]|uniref:hypothetical protein n=1 Tax=Burkholderia ubonensis TaxID=101571 RepID=UPI002AB1EBCD
EIMNTVSRFVNNFFYYIVATAGFIFLGEPGVQSDRPNHPLPPSAPRCRQRERGVILGTSRVPRKGVREINSKAPVRGRARGLLR